MPKASPANKGALMPDQTNDQMADEALASLLKYYRATAPFNISVLAERMPRHKSDAIALLSYQVQGLTKLVEILIKVNGLATGGSMIGDTRDEKSH